MRYYLLEVIKSLLKAQAHSLISVFGMGIEDISWGYTVYQQAIKKGLVQKIKLWDKPYWY
jgi:ornithine cyclodeaminase/alanine dehydrogenase-like protein (mu-crystallin family)